MRLLTLVLFVTFSFSISNGQQRPKNLQVFKDLPATQLDPTMAFISGALGVRCSYCHVANQFDKDDKPTKLAARRMIQMVFDINKEALTARAR